MMPRSLLASYLVMTVSLSMAMAQENADNCPADLVSFEVITGFVYTAHYTAPQDMLNSQLGILNLNDCIETCRGDSSCKSLNFATGWCVLFSSTADENKSQLTKSHADPVFTFYVQKNCLHSAATCDAGWSFERVMNYELDTEIRKRGQVGSRQECMELCLKEVDFECRSAMYKAESGECQLSAMDRHSIAGSPGFAAKEGVDYLEINCVNDPTEQCQYTQVRGKLLKTPDAVYQGIASEEDCRVLCQNAPFRCHSYDYGDTGDDVCRLSHHSAMTLTQIEEPYLKIEAATTNELSCYNNANAKSILPPFLSVLFVGHHSHPPLTLLAHPLALKYTLGSSRAEPRPSLVVEQPTFFFAPPF